MVCRSTPVGHSSFIKPKQQLAYHINELTLMSPLWSQLLLTELTVVKHLHRNVWVCVFFLVDMICVLCIPTSFSLAFQYEYVVKSRLPSADVIHTIIFNRLTGVKSVKSDSNMVSMEGFSVS